MITITFSQTFTFPADSVRHFALFLGWQPVVPIPIFDESGKQIADEPGNNPETFVEFVRRRAREHSLTFMTSWAEHLKQEAIQAAIAQIEPEIYAQTVQPVNDALTDEVTYEP